VLEAAQGNHQPAVQTIEQVALHIQQKRGGGRMLASSTGEDLWITGVSEKPRRARYLRKCGRKSAPRSRHCFRFGDLVEAV
jgi:hypothetical protein